MTLLEWLRKLGKDLWRFTESVEDWIARLKREGEAFQAENAQRPGVTVTASGLQVEVLRAGEGPCPQETDYVVVHYEGRLVDGTVFDSSFRKKGQPVAFRLDMVIPGWKEGLQRMAVGGRSRLVIPPALAYGDKGVGYLIGPEATLIFDVELIEISPPESVMDRPWGWERGYAGGYTIGDEPAPADAPETTPPPGR